MWGVGLITSFSDPSPLTPLEFLDLSVSLYLNSGENKLGLSPLEIPQHCAILTPLGKSNPRSKTKTMEQGCEPDFKLKFQGFKGFPGYFSEFSGVSIMRIAGFSRV